MAFKLGKSPLVSVILTNYNFERYISESIESVLNQTYKNLELIIVDDGSSDRSREIIDTILDHRIRKIYKVNEGQASALNAGLKISQGEIIAFIDSDDYWKKEKLELCVKSHLINDKYCIVQHNLEIISDNNQLTGKTHPNITPGIINASQEYLIKNHTGFFSSTSGITCKRKYLEKITPLDIKWKICADVAMTRPLALYGETLTLKDNLGFYRIHDKNNWMNTEEQAKSIENQQKYADYTNFWLNKLGYSERIDFKKSVIYKKLKQSKSIKNLLYRKILSKISAYTDGIF